MSQQRALPASLAGARLPAAPRRRERWQKLGLRLGLLAAVLLAWQAIGDDSAKLATPTFTRTAAAFLDLVRNGELVDGLVESNKAMVGGYLLALVVSLPLGILMGNVRIVERVVQPYLTMLLALPLIAVLPLIQSIFGLGLASRTVVVFLFAFVYVTVNTTVGVRGTDPRLREMARSFGATRWQMLTQIVLPSAFPSIMAGARLGLSRAIVGMVVAELFLVGEGVGNLIMYYRSHYDPAPVFALALVLVLEGVAVMAVARRLELRLTKR
jgi:ABC-type nitrate/sulfonate/bicarbonate transport system permease component